MTKIVLPMCLNDGSVFELEANAIIADTGALKFDINRLYSDVSHAYWTPVIEDLELFIKTPFIPTLIQFLQWCDFCDLDPKVYFI